MREAVARDSRTVSRGPWPTDVGNRSWSAVHGPRSTVHDLLSASIEPDAARLLHFPDPVLRAWASVGFHRQRGRQPAGLLPPARGASLHHGCSDGRRSIGKDADSLDASDLPGISGTGGAFYRAGSGADSNGGRPASGARAGAGSACGLRSAGSNAHAHSRRSRTSSSEPKLNFSLNKQP